MRKIKRCLGFISLIVTLCLVAACGAEPSPPLVLEEVIVGTWATDMPDPDYDDWLFDGHTFEFKRNGEYISTVGYSGTAYKESGTFTISDTILEYTREDRTRDSTCIDLPSTERFEVLSIEQNKITLKILTHTNNCDEVVPGFNPTLIGAELVLERCEWPPNAETEVFAACTPIESE